MGLECVLYLATGEGGRGFGCCGLYADVGEEGRVGLGRVGLGMGTGIGMGMERDGMEWGC